MNLPLDPAHPVDCTDSWHREQALGYVVVDEPGEIGVVHARRGDAVGQHRLARQIELADDGVAQVAGQVGADARDG